MIVVNGTSLVLWYIFDPMVEKKKTGAHAKTAITSSTIKSSAVTAWCDHQSKKNGDVAAVGEEGCDVGKVLDLALTSHDLEGTSRGLVSELLSRQHGRQEDRVDGMVRSWQLGHFEDDRERGAIGAAWQTSANAEPSKFSFVQGMTSPITMTDKIKNSMMH